MPDTTITAPAIPESITITAEASSARNDGMVSITGTAFSGGAIEQSWSGCPIYLELSGLKVRSQIPLLYSHQNDPQSRVGAVSVTNTGRELTIAGQIDTHTPFGAFLAEAGRRIPWQLSVGCGKLAMAQLDANATLEVNGQTVTGPAYVVKSCELVEVSIVAVGADSATQLQIAAALSSVSLQTTPTQGNTNMPETIIKNKVELEQPVSTPAPAPVEDIQAAERARCAEVMRICARYPELGSQAVSDGWTADRARQEVLARLEAEYPVSAPNVNTGAGAPAAERVLAAATMATVGVSDNDIARSCGESAVEAAHHQYPRGIGLQELIIEAACANGARPGCHRLSAGNWYEVASAACRPLQAGASAVNLPGLLGGVLNRRLLDGFGSVSTAWRDIADVASVTDFRAFQSYRLVSGGGFQKVTNGGEIKHGELGESQYTNQVETYGEMLSLTRQDIINDDLNAFSRIPFLLGQEAAIKINEIFWGVFLNNADFFKSDNGNVASGAPLSVAGLTTALASFRGLKENGRLLGQAPAILLVPTELEVVANQLFADQQLLADGVASSKSVAFATNPHRGKYRPVVSPYLSEPTFTGYSATSWYLLSDPRFRAAIQIAFLNGVQAPHVETAEAEFNKLGLQYRAYLDWGCALQDPKAGIKANA